VVGPSKQASKQANIHTHRCYEVTLVWGSLRLAPIINSVVALHVQLVAWGLLETTAVQLQ